jgi:hypothetical protein
MDTRREIVLGIYDDLRRIVGEFERERSPDEEQITRIRSRVEKDVAEIAKLDRRFSHAHLESARFYWAAGEREDAFNALEKARKIRESNPQVYLLRGRFRLNEYISQQTMRLTQISFNELIRSFGTPEGLAQDTEAMRSLMETGVRDLVEYRRLARQQRGEPATGEAELAFAEGVQAFYDEQYERAGPLLRSAVSSTHVNRDAALLLAIVHSMTGAYEKIEADLVQAGPNRETEANIRVFIGIHLLARLEEDPDNEKLTEALIEDMARMILLGEQGQTTILDMVPPILLQRYSPLISRAKDRAELLRGR